MKKFTVIYYAPAEAMASMATATPEEKAAGMKPWMDWMAKVGEKLVDGGSPFMPGERIESNGSSKPSNSEITGYSILEATDMAEAKSLLEGHPHLAWWDGCAIEVLECIPMG